MTKPKNGSKPGQKVEESKIVREVDSQGRDTGREKTVVRGEPYPPTSKPGNKYVTRVVTRHKK